MGKDRSPTLVVKLIGKRRQFHYMIREFALKRRRAYDVKQALAGRQPSFVSQFLSLMACRN